MTPAAEKDGAMAGVQPVREAAGEAGKMVLEFWITPCTPVGVLAPS
jgi:hypothetical protein